MSETKIVEMDIAQPADAVAAPPKPSLWNRYRSSIGQASIPTGALIVFLLLWQWYVREAAIPLYILPAPSDIAVSLFNDWEILFAALLITLKITFAALAAALIGGVLSRSSSRNRVSLNSSFILMPSSCRSRPSSPSRR